MSAFAVQSEPPQEGQSYYGTKDLALAATLGNLGFEAEYRLPVLLVVSAPNIIDFVDKNTGRMQDCAHLEFRFEAEILSPVFGRISARDIFLAHEIAKLTQKEQTKEISGAESLKLLQLRERWRNVVVTKDGNNHSGTLLWAVQMLYDQGTNIFVLSAVVEELSKNPMIEFSKKVYKGVAYAVEPLEAEPHVQRRQEKFMRK